MSTESKRNDHKKRVLWSIVMLVVIWVIIGVLFSTALGGFIAGLFAAGAFYLGTTPDENQDLYKD